MKARQQKEVNAFPMFFAFSNEQFAQGMQRLGLDPKEKDKIIAFGDTGGFLRKSDEPALLEMLERHRREMKEAIKADKNERGFIYDMFSYELANHEYSWTEDPSEAIQALGLTLEDIENSPIMRRALSRAMEDQHFL